MPFTGPHRSLAIRSFASFASPKLPLPQTDTSRRGCFGHNRSPHGIGNIPAPATHEYMAESSWREDLITCFPTIDDQHREIARRTDELLLSFTADKPDSELEEVLTGLIDATAKHFATEEGLMLARGYAAFEEHRSEHRRLLEQLQLVKRSLPAGHVMARETVAAFIQTLTAHHIVLSDKPLAKFLIECGF